LGTGIRNARVAGKKVEKPKMLETHREIPNEQRPKLNKCKKKQRLVVVLLFVVPCLVEK
jgi:hypothetical protein